MGNNLALRKERLPTLFFFCPVLSFQTEPYVIVEKWTSFSFANPRFSHSRGAPAKIIYRRKGISLIGQTDQNNDNYSEIYKPVKIQACVIAPHQQEKQGTGNYCLMVSRKIKAWRGHWAA
jgi:hypothetical protein